MSKNIIVCADGTGNRGGVGRGTNVWRLYNALDWNSTKPRQVAKYHDGVGTDSTLFFKILGAAFGWGLTNNVRHLYRYIALNYEEGDNVYLFGFSRGAYTVRVLHNVLHFMGVPSNPKKFTPEELDLHIKNIVNEYKLICKEAYKNKQEPDKRVALEKAFDEHREHIFIGGHQHAVKDITIGVWDTVNAVGAPANWIRQRLCAPWTRDIVIRDLPGENTHARHAIALDDERSTYNPLFWPKGKTETVDDRIIQVWFSGAHANCGGGYPKDGLAHVSLDWMLTEMERICVKTKRPKLAFSPSALESIKNNVNAHDKLYDSRSALAMYYRFLPRKALNIVNRGNHHFQHWADSKNKHRHLHAESIDDQQNSDLPAHEFDYLTAVDNITLPVVHSSVIERLLARTESYLPTALPCQFKVWQDKPSSGAKNASKVSKPEMQHFALNVHDGGHETPAKTCFDKVHKINKARGVVWSLFAAISASIFAFPLIYKLIERGCVLFDKTCELNRDPSMFVQAGSPIKAVAPDISMPWVNWSLMNLHISGVFVAILLGLYIVNRKQRREMRTQAHRLWQYLPVKSKVTAAKNIDHSSLTKLQTAQPAVVEDEGDSLLDKLKSVDLPDAISEPLEKLKKGSARHLDKVSSKINEFNGMDY